MASYFNNDGLVHVKTLREMSETKQDHGRKNADKLTTKKLLKTYLCKGAKSSCVIHGRCYSGAPCEYGKRYLTIIEGDEHGETE